MFKQSKQSFRWRRPGGHRLAIMVVTFAIILFLSCLSACSGGDSSKPAATRREAAVPVAIATVEKRDVPVELRVIGSVEPYSTVGVRSQVTGQLVGVHFTEGQNVKKGDLLFTLDARPFEAEVRKQEANLARDLAQAENQRAQSGRYEQLFKEGVISNEMYDQVRSNADALDAAVRSDRASIEAARLNLQYTSIHSPIDGRTGNLMVHQGNMVKDNDIDLVTINQVQPINVGFNVPEQYLADIKKFMERGGLNVMVSVPDQPQPVQGKVSFVNNTVDAATASIRLKAVFPNEGVRLWPGQFADVLLTLTIQSNAVVVPSQAVQIGQDGDYVFVVDDKQNAQVRNIKVSRTVEGISVISEGLKTGERVVTDGQLRLTPTGSKVEIKAAEGESPSDPVAEPRQSLRKPGMIQSAPARQGANGS